MITASSKADQRLAERASLHKATAFAEGARRREQSAISVRRAKRRGVLSSKRLRRSTAARERLGAAGVAAAGSCAISKWTCSCAFLKLVSFTVCCHLLALRLAMRLERRCVGFNALNTMVTNVFSPSSNLFFTSASVSSSAGSLSPSSIVPPTPKRL